MPPQVKVGVDPGLQRRQPELLEAADFPLGEILERDLGQRRTAPQPQGVPQQLACLCRVTRLEGTTAVAVPRGEHLGVQLVRVDVQEIAAADGPQPRPVLPVQRRQRPPQS